LQRDQLSLDYEYLNSISPDQIIYYQEKYPLAWKDHIAVMSLLNDATSGESSKEINTYNEYVKALLAQLDSNKQFVDLDWIGISRNAKNIIIKHRRILEKYALYNPNAYGFPVEKASIYDNTFGADRENGQRKHEGTDLFNNKGTKIVSVCAGTVEQLGWNRLGGERVGIRGSDGNYYYYAHLDKINSNLYITKQINKGDLLGTMGNTGDAATTPDHLHFGIELPNGNWVNPYSFVKVWEYYSLKNK
jgi:murein DD-endopeptidase MepM/ murein hydrolase activator NlpD